MSGRTCSRLSFLLIFAGTAAIGGPSDSIYVSRSGRVYEIASGEARILDRNNQVVGRFDPHKVIVRLEPGEVLSQDSVIGAGVLEASVKGRQYGAGRYAAVYLSPGSSPLTSLKAIESLPGVEYAYFDRLATLLSESNDPLFTEQWSLADSVTGVPTAWEMEEGSEGVLIALLDTGIDFNHPDLVNIVWQNLGEDFDGDGSAIEWNSQTAEWQLDTGDLNSVDDDGNQYVDDLLGWDFVGDSYAVVDSAGHGTAMAGVIAAERNNQIGIGGLAGGSMGGGSRVMNLKVSYQFVGGPLCPPEYPCPAISMDAVATALIYARENGASIGNMSFIAYQTDSSDVENIPVDQEMQIANEQFNMVFAAGSGNIGQIYFGFPCNDYSTICVGASKEDDTRAGFSGAGPQLDVLAPGDEILSTDARAPGGYNPGDYAYGSGTSQATAYVSGMAALMKSIDATKPWWEFREIINRTAVELPAQAGYDTLHGHGRVDVLRALAATKYNAEVADSIYSSDEAWTESEFPNVYLPGDVLITNAVSIDVFDGTQVYAATADRNNFGSDDEKVEIIVHGTFRAEFGPGTSFQSARDVPEEDDWWGIRVYDDGVIYLDDCEVKHSIYGVFVDAGSGYEVPGYILNGTFSQNSVDITVEGTGEFLVSGNNLTVDTGWGMAIRDGGGSITISGNTVTGSSGALNGISIGPKWIAPTITGNTVSGFGLGHAIAQYNGVVTYTQNTLNSSMHGILVAGGTATIGTESISSDNIFKFNTNGILVDELLTVNSVVVRNNRFGQNAVGIETDVPLKVNLGTAGNFGRNNLKGQIVHCIKNTGVGTLSAIGNYFGACGPPITCTFGSVDVSQPLCVPPASTVPGVEIVAGEPVRTLTVSPAAPNPTRGESGVPFTLGEGSARVALEIFDVVGRRVRYVEAVQYPTGDHRIWWDGANDQGIPVENGMYFARVVANASLVGTTKVLVVR